MPRNIDKAEKTFLKYYPELTAEEAARKAGFSANQAPHMAQVFLSKKSVQKAVREKEEQALDDAGPDIRKLLLEMMWIARVDIRDMFNDDGTLKTPNQLDRRTARSVLSFKVKESGDIERGNFRREFEYKLHPKTPVLDMLAKHLGIFKEAEKNVNVNVKLADMRTDELERRLAQLGTDVKVIDHDSNA